MEHDGAPSGTTRLASSEIGDELVGEQEAAAGVLPAHERLEGDDRPASREVDDRLVVHDEFAIADRGAKLRLDRELGQRVVAHPGVKTSTRSRPPCLAVYIAMSALRMRISAVIPGSAIARPAHTVGASSCPPTSRGSWTASVIECEEALGRRLDVRRSRGRPQTRLRRAARRCRPRAPSLGSVRRARRGASRRRRGQASR